MVINAGPISVIWAGERPHSVDNIIVEVASIGAAKYVLYLMVFGFAAVWIFLEDRRGKVALALNAVIGLAIALALMKLADGLFDNPRPFVINPDITPLIPHDPDNGFPSNHASAAGLMAALVLLRHRMTGLIFVVLALIVADGRVAVRVHHWLDVGGGLVIGTLAAITGTLLVTWLLRATGLLDRPPLAKLVGPEKQSGRHRAG